MKRYSPGFTLLEMLVAIAILASLALMAQLVTNGVIRVSTVVAEQEQKLKTVQQAMSFMSHDLTQMIPRPIRNAKGERETALLTGMGVLASDSEGIRFVRGGVVNLQGQLLRSNFLTVGYRIRGSYLERLIWPLTDAADSVEPVTQKLIHADWLSLQFSDGSRWQEIWPFSQEIPVAVRMTLHTPEWGRIERIWLLRGPLSL